MARGFHGVWEFVLFRNNNILAPGGAKRTREGARIINSLMFVGVSSNG